MAAFDAWGKPEPGITDGNTNWFGRSDFCTFQSEPENEVHYCVSKLFTFKFGGLAQYRRPAESPYEAIYIPKNRNINLGLCLPKSCSANEINNAYEAGVNLGRFIIIVEVLYLNKST
jgi:hypothetical protein